jgi:alkanesulfonate monooxygenase SsuD/methylene tetrahydromethanopterin reductase-like flavin-dependent oxidoreductase (luciferase family)
VAYRFAVIDTSTELWDPPPSRPSLAPAWIGASLSSTMILALVAAGGVVAHAWNDERYRETGNACSRLDITAVATRLGDPGLRPQPSRTPGACAYVVENENGSWDSYGSVQMNYSPNAVGAWLAWRNQETTGDPREVPDLGRAARLTVQARNVEGEDVCSASVDVLDSNLLFRTGIGTDADMPSRPCDDLEALGDALIESARTSLARLAGSP